LDISFSPNNIWDANSAVLNYCHQGIPVTRMTNYGLLHKTDSNIVSIEQPKGTAGVGDLNPFYPYPTQKNLVRIDRLRVQIKSLYPNLHLLGRLAQYKYIDMFQAIGAGMKLADELDAALN
jgi:UDP-galactopyranose mutase